MEECRKRGIKVGNTPGVLTNATVQAGRPMVPHATKVLGRMWPAGAQADLALALLLATCRLVPKAVHEAKTCVVPACLCPPLRPAHG